MIRKPTVDEWFLALQLKEIKKSFHVPFYLEADITRLVENLKTDKIPYTSILIKAASRLIQETPELNKVVFHTCFGIRICEPSYNAVNVPVELEVNGKKMLTGISIKDAYKKTLSEISTEIKATKSKTLDDLPLNKIIHSRGFKIIKKLKLKLIHTLMKNFPLLYIKKHGGGISVSSLMNLSHPHLIVNMNAMGMTVMTISSCTVEKTEGRHILRVGLAFDHNVVHGSIGTKGALDLVKILQSPDMF